ncbi:MAG: fibronectin type III domain-containing protein, partial [Methanomassiliicoccales archaeon]
VTIPDNVTSIGDWAFAECTSLTSVSIGSNVTSISYCAFYNCSSLISVTMGSGVTSIDYGAFGYCGSLISVTMGNGVTTIGDFAFYDCSSLTSVTIPDSVTSIGDWAFYNCSSLTDITVSASNSYYANNGGDGVLYDKALTTLIQYPAGNARTSFTIIGSVISIWDDAFYNCSSLTSVSIGSNVTSIGNWTFDSCSYLTEMRFYGNAPDCGEEWHYGCNASLVVYYKSGASGFTDPWYDLPTMQMVAPSAPELISASPGASCVTLVWIAPLSDGNSPITGYKAYYGTVEPTTPFGGTLSATTFSLNITDLTPGTEYYFAVRAVNAVGDSVNSNVQSAIPYTIPGAPTLESCGSGSSQVALAWTAPSSIGFSPLTGYEVFYGTTAPDRQYEGLLPPEFNMANVMDLIPGTSYYFAVRAVNAAGEGPLSNAMVAIPYTWPDPPELVSAQSGILQVTLTWNAPAFIGFNDISGYKVFFGTSFPDEQFGDELSSSSRSVNVTGLLAGTTYYFGVKALNEAGNSDLSNILDAVPYTIPGAPALTSAVAGVNSAVISWTIPVNNGSTPITGYNVYYGSAGPTIQFGGTLPATTLTISITGLTAGTQYYLAVKAVNVAGNSSSSNILNVTTPTVPGAPSSLTATSGNAQVVLAWTAPISDGGSAIDYYV